MIDAYTFEQCKKDNAILKSKISNLQHALKQSELMVSESKMDAAALIFLRLKIAESTQDLEVLYLLRKQQEGLDR